MASVFFTEEIPASLRRMDAPTLYVIVTGATGTINWAGKTWVLPTDSGVEFEVVPSTYKYEVQTGNPGSFSANRYILWGASALTLFAGMRRVGVSTTTTGIDNWSLIVKGQTDQLQRTEPGGSEINSKCQISAVCTDPGSPTWDNLSMPTPMLTNSVTVSAITYSWRRGRGW